MNLHKPLSIALLLIAGIHLQAQKETLVKVLELKMPKTADDEFCGTRGAAVCWNPQTKNYIAAFAGNSSYPMGVFNATGKLISDSDLVCLGDMRGIWYNPDAKKISGNTYNDNGWLSYTTNNKGIPIGDTVDFKGMHQPNEQSVGAFDSESKTVYFLYEGKVSFYDVTKAEKTGSVAVHWGVKKSDAKDEKNFEPYEHLDYNTTSAIYSGVKGAEIGVLNTAERQIEFYDKKEGYLKKILLLPDDLPLEESFNFSYANNIYWFFDMKNRKWIGVK